MGRPDRSSNRDRGSAPVPVGGVREDIRALNSSILLITQKIKYIVRNEKILGRNLIVLNKKLKSLEEKIVSPKEVSGNNASSEDIVSLKKKIELLEAQVGDIQQRMVFKEELKELRYIIDTINPLEFATLSQVKDLIEKSKK
ncbi:MAG: hypothetical protein PHP82_03885 [Candidatus ainarchaeum sp.]|nr:hypothetical protein [Candidatus ainarchaeum sp.]